MNAPIPEEALAKIKRAIVGGRKIEAIRLFRDVTGAGLAEAKAAVEHLEVELRAAAPESLGTTAGGGRPPIKLVAGVPFGCLVGVAPFVAFGFVMLIWGVQSGLTTWSFAAGAVRTEGTVVRLDNWVAGKGHSNTQCHAVFSYQVDGKTHEVRGYLQMQPGVHGWPKGYQVGDVATLIYDPQKPSDAMLDSFSLWVGPLIPTGIGLTFLLIGAGLFWTERRKRRAQGMNDE